MTEEMTPFADDSHVLTVGGLTIENGVQEIVIHGEMEIRSDKEGLTNARALAAVLRKTVEALEAMPDLPERHAPEEEDGGEVDNPFR